MIKLTNKNVYTVTKRKRVVQEVHVNKNKTNKKQTKESYVDTRTSEREGCCNDGWMFLSKRPHNDVLGNTEKRRSKKKRSEVN